MDTRIVVIGQGTRHSGNTSAGVRPRSVADSTASNPCVGLYTTDENGVDLITDSFRLLELKRFTAVGFDQLTKSAKNAVGDSHRDTHHSSRVTIQLNGLHPSPRAIENISAFMSSNSSKQFKQPLTSLCPLDQDNGTFEELLDTYALASALKLRPNVCTNGLLDMIRDQIGGRKLLAKDMHDILARNLTMKLIVPAMMTSYKRFWDGYSDAEVADLLEFQDTHGVFGQRLARVDRAKLRPPPSTKPRRPERDRRQRVKTERRPNAKAIRATGSRV